MRGKLVRELRQEMEYGRRRNYSLTNKVITTFTNSGKKVKSFTIVSDSERKVYQHTKKGLKKDIYAKA